MRQGNQGKYNKLTKANVLLLSAFLSNLSLPGKTLSLSTQKENTDIITIVNLVQITHIKLEKIYSSHPEKIFEQVPTLEDVLSNIGDQKERVMFNPGYY